MITNDDKLALLRLKLAMAEGAFLMASRSEEFSDAEVGRYEIRMIAAHRALQEAMR